MKKSIFLFIFVSVLLVVLSACSQINRDIEIGGEGPLMTIYKTPGCGCCKGYVAYLKEQDIYRVEVVDMNDLTPVKEKYKIPEDSFGCHTSIIGKYFVEGHVPIEVINRLLDEQPDIDGIALPGMPAGSPGMSGVVNGTLTIYSIKDGVESVYAEVSP